MCQVRRPSLGTSPNSQSGFVDEKTNLRSTARLAYRVSFSRLIPLLGGWPSKQILLPAVGAPSIDRFTAALGLYGVLRLHKLDCISLSSVRDSERLLTDNLFVNPSSTVHKCQYNVKTSISVLQRDPLCPCGGEVAKSQYRLQISSVSWVLTKVKDLVKYSILQRVQDLIWGALIRYKTNVKLTAGSQRLCSGRGDESSLVSAARKQGEVPGNSVGTPITVWYNCTLSSEK